MKASSNLKKREQVPMDWLLPDGMVLVPKALVCFDEAEVRWKDGDSGPFVFKANHATDLPKTGELRRRMDDSPEGRTPAGDWASQQLKRYIEMTKARFRILPFGTINGGARWLGDVMMTEPTGGWAYMAQLSVLWGWSMVYWQYRPLGDPFRWAGDNSVEVLTPAEQALLGSCLELEAQARRNGVGMWSSQWRGERVPQLQRKLFRGELKPEAAPTIADMMKRAG